MPLSFFFCHETAPSRISPIARKQWKLGQEQGIISGTFISVHGRLILESIELPSAFEGYHQFSMS